MSILASPFQMFLWTSGKQMPQAIMLVCRIPFSLVSSLIILRSGHPVPRPEELTVKPQVGGKRSGLLPPFPRTINHETFLRGAWPTDGNGVAQFTST